MRASKILVSKLISERALYQPWESHLEWVENIKATSD